MAQIVHMAQFSDVVGHISAWIFFFKFHFSHKEETKPNGACRELDCTPKRRGNLWSTSILVLSKCTLTAFLEPFWLRPFWLSILSMLVRGSKWVGLGQSRLIGGVQTISDPLLEWVRFPQPAPKAVQYGLTRIDPHNLPTGWFDPVNPNKIVDAARKIMKVWNLKWKVRGAVGIESGDSYTLYF